jgi:quercetin dioxygenase-like cupin family protein
MGKAGLPEPYVSLPGTSELRWMGETFTYFLATGHQTGGAFSMIDERAKRGEAIPLHRHREDPESFYVLEGEIMLFINNEPGVRAGAGTFAHIPGGTVHGFRVESDTARYLILTTPRHGEFYRAISHPSRPGGLPAVAPVDGSQVMQACEQYGVELIGALPESGSQPPATG